MTADKKAFPYMMQGSNVTVIINNIPHTISKNHIFYDKLIEGIKNGDWDTVEEVVNPKKTVINYGKGNISIQGDKLFWGERELHNALTVRIIEMYRHGYSIEPMVLFMENLMQNPSYRAVNELYGFMESCTLPITPDGHFLAYKKVRENYTDVHTGTMDNSVGKVVEMERNEVDDNKDRTCSSGLHFCSQSYLSVFGGERIMIVKVNPRDVVSIPSDYNNAKGRACRYEVIGELGVDPDKAFTEPVAKNANGIEDLEKQLAQIADTIKAIKGKQA